MLEHFFPEFFQPFRSDNPVFFTHRQQHFVCRFNATGRAEGNIPALNTILPGKRFQFLNGRHARALEIYTGNGAAREVHLRKADTAHTAAFNQFGFEVFADDQLSRPAADIDYQFAAFFRLGMFHAHKNQTRFLVTRNDFNRVGDHFFRAFEKLWRIQRLAQRVCSDNTHARCREPLQAFGEQRQAG